MAATEFLATLHAESECPEQANDVAAHLMRTKGYPGMRPIGVFIDGSLLYYYYRLPEGVLELELSWMGDEARWTRRVSDFITNPADVLEMLGPEEDGEPEPARGATHETDPALPMFKAPSV